MRPTRRQSYDQALAALRAEIRAGELLREMEKNKGARATGNNQQKKVRSSPATAPDNYGTQSRAAARPLMRYPRGRWLTSAEAAERMGEFGRPSCAAQK